MHDLTLFIGPVLGAGILLALLSGPIGCLLVWQRLAFFGDALAHSALLGMALGLVLNLNIHLSILCLCLILAMGLGVSQRSNALSSDTRLAMLSQGTLALGLIALSFFPQMQGELNSFLFGDLLSLSHHDLVYILMLTGLSGVLLKIYWRRFIMFIVSPDIAQIEGQNILQTKLIFFLTIGLYVAVAAKAVGVLLMTALLIIPAATARLFARTPVQMAILAALFGVVSLLIGCGVSYQFDIPATPAVVIAALSLFALSTVRRPR